MLQAELVNPRPYWATVLTIERGLNTLPAGFEFQAMGTPFFGSAFPRGGVIQFWLRRKQPNELARLFTLARGRDGRFHVKEIAHDQRPQRQAHA